MHAWWKCSSSGSCQWLYSWEYFWGAWKFTIQAYLPGWNSRRWFCHHSARLRLFSSPSRSRLERIQSELDAPLQFKVRYCVLSLSWETCLSISPFANWFVGPRWIHHDRSCNGISLGWTSKCEYRIWFWLLLSLKAKNSSLALFISWFGLLIAPTNRLAPVDEVLISWLCPPSPTNKVDN